MYNIVNTTNPTVYDSEKSKELDNRNKHTDLSPALFKYLFIQCDPIVYTSGNRIQKYFNKAMTFDLNSGLGVHVLSVMLCDYLGNRSSSV